jgi:hypothetical protein
MRVMGTDIYIVSGNSLFVLNSSKTSVNLGVVSGHGPVRITDNGTHLAIAVDNGPLYYANRSGLTVLPEGPMNGATYQDGYGIFTEAGTQRVWISNLDDMTTITATDFTSADALTGNVVGCVSDHREPWVFKETSTEVFQNTGAADFPFQRVQLIERGCIASGSITKARNAVLWLGDDKMPYMAAGYQPQPLAPPWIKRLIDNVGDATKAESFVYEQDGHTFWVLGFDDLTLVYDLDTGMWHDRLTYGELRWRVETYAMYDNLHLVGDYSGGQVYELDLDTYDDNGTNILREVTSPPLFDRGHWIAISELYVDFDTGVGITSGHGSDPQAVIDWTDDGGETFSNQVWADMGAIGEYDRRVTYNRLGQFRQRTLRLRVSAPVKAIVRQAFARIEVRGP